MDKSNDINKIRKVIRKQLNEIDSDAPANTPPAPDFFRNVGELKKFLETIPEDLELVTSDGRWITASVSNEAGQDVLHIGTWG